MSKNFSELYTNLVRMLPIGLRSHIVNETHWVSPLVRALVENQTQLLDRIELLEKTLKDHSLRPHVIKKFEGEDWFKTYMGWRVRVRVLEDFYTKEVLYKEVLIDDKVYFVNGIEGNDYKNKPELIPGRLYEKDEQIYFMIRGEK